MARPARTYERGFTLIEVLIVMVILAILMAIAIPLYSSSKNSAKEKRSTAAEQQLRAVVVKARDRELKTLSQILGGPGNASSCTQDPLPRMDTLSGACKVAWDDVVNKLAPYAGSVQAAQQVMTDGDQRPILVDARENACNNQQDVITAVHPGDGNRAKKTTSLTIVPSRYGC